MCWDNPSLVSQFFEIADLFTQACTNLDEKWIVSVRQVFENSLIFPLSTPDETVRPKWAVDLKKNNSITGRPTLTNPLGDISQLDTSENE